jgi:hypothetical protein
MAPSKSELISAGRPVKVCRPLSAFECPNASALRAKAGGKAETEEKAKLSKAIAKISTQF